MYTQAFFMNLYFVKRGGCLHYQTKSIPQSFRLDWTGHHSSWDSIMLIEAALDK